MEVSGLLFRRWKPSSKPTNSQVQEGGSEVGVTSGSSLLTSLSQVLGTFPQTFHCPCYITLNYSNKHLSFLVSFSPDKTVSAGLSDLPTVKQLEVAEWGFKLLTIWHFMCSSVAESDCWHSPNGNAFVGVDHSGTGAQLTTVHE